MKTETWVNVYPEPHAMHTIVLDKESDEVQIVIEDEGGNPSGNSVRIYLRNGKIRISDFGTVDMIDSLNFCKESCNKCEANSKDRGDK